MLSLREDRFGAPVLGSALLDHPGVPHAFATRKGGVSRGQFESLIADKLRGQALVSVP